MVTLYHGSGSSECEIIRPAGPPEKLAKLRTVVIQLLQAQHNQEAAQLLETGDFELFEATNGFGDEFFALAKKARAEVYMDYSIRAADQDFRFPYLSMANAFSHVGYYVRFVVVELDTDTTIEPVNVNATVAPVEVVKRALQDAQQLLATNGAISAIDRVHTALHGYLKWVCEQAGNLPATKDPSITELLQAAGRHPKLSQQRAHSETIDRVLRAFAKILDAVNQIRNRGSMAHPNMQLVDEADAMLVVNAVRTISRYFDDRLA